MRIASSTTPTTARRGTRSELLDGRRGENENENDNENDDENENENDNGNENDNENDDENIHPNLLWKFAFSVVKK